MAAVPSPRRAGGDEVWRLGLLIEAISLAPLQASPLSVLVVPQSASPNLNQLCDAIAICKGSTLDTYNFVNDYTSKGCPVKHADLDNCKWPHVLVAPAALARRSLNLEWEGLDIQCPDDLQVKTGSTHPVSPTLLLVSHLFLTAYGFVSKERVWFRSTVTVPLERVVLALPAPGLSEGQVRDVVGQLYSRGRSLGVIVHQGMDLYHQLEEKDPATLKLSVLETSPVLQGRLTDATTIAVLPPEEPNHSPSPSPKWEKRPRSASALSASDLSHEYSYSSLLAQSAIPQPEDFIIQVVPAPHFKLHSQYIVLPKQMAVRHSIFAGQPVMLSRAEPELEESLDGGNRTISELVIDLDHTPQSKKPRQHLALAVSYEDAATLQKYVPAPSLLHRYNGESLQMAYIDCYLLFSLFPETLAFSRRFHLRIAAVPDPDSIPSIENFSVSLVTIPPGRIQLATTEHTRCLKAFFSDKTMHIHLGDVFPVETSSGKVFYNYHRLEPQSKRTVLSGTVSGRTYKNCSVMVNMEHSYVPYLVPPSATFPTHGFWTHLHPPGLEQYCDTLFSWLVPGLLPPKERPSRSPSVLLSGPPGVGKRTILKAVVRRCRLNLMELNCYEFSSEALGAAEQKLMGNLSNALVSSPVVVLLSHVHVLGRMQNGKEEPRVATAFETFISDVSVFNTKRDYPVVIVGTTTHPHKVSPQIHSCFLHHMEVSSPTERHREALFTGLSSEYLVARDVDWSDLAKRTAGFLLGDFVALFSRASHLALQKAISYCSLTKSGCNIQDLLMAGVVLDQEHLEASLDLLHSAHSDAIGAPKIPNVQWEDVGGLAEAKREILDTIQLPLLHPELFTSGLRRSGVLLYGAPGTGKTLLAKAVATECSLNFLSVKGPELINMYVGQSEENVREVFVRARSAAPCVIFFDELDSIAPNRGRSGDSGGVMDRVVSQLLAELDGLQKSEDVFVIGATNRPDLLDQALLRPGRFDRLVYLGVSEDVESKTNVLRAITRRFNLDPNVDLECLASQCPANTTGADLYSLCSDAALIALRRQIAELELKELSDDDWQGELVVMEEDFQLALSSLTPSVSPEELKRYTELERNHGTHKSQSTA